MPNQPNATATTESFEFDALAEAANYRAALLREFAPVLKGRVVEVGAGIGQFTSEIATLPTVTEIVPIEPEAKFCEQFRQRLPNREIIQGTIDNLPAAFHPDAIVCVNVLEHIEDDLAELRKFRQRLQPQRGHLCLFVPARPEIYAPIDRDFGHFRRYTRPELRKKLTAAGFTIPRLDYFNSVGYFAWWLNFCVLKKRAFDVKAVRVFDRIIFPVVNTLESRLVRPPFGQSLIAIARAN
ncbi:MAG TPA: methyltransferase domain-containing protein [Verrucomicrobiae bacterium]|jgi:SAM-dependent methyltransferase|nr:methyltransferase domain-containing protein [Verrucomicrobiae bacterium]